MTILTFIVRAARWDNDSTERYRKFYVKATSWELAVHEAKARITVRERIVNISEGGYQQ